MIAEYMMLAAGLTVFLLTLYWVRKRELREKYAMAWMAAATVALAAGVFPGAVMYLAPLLQLSYPSLVLLLCLIMGYFFAVCTSIALSRQYRRNLRLTQEVALLENRVRRLENELKGK